ncbi:PEP-CTERM sorting domain-containing protein [Oxalobacteraceae bacterium A2-2]
MRFTVLSLAALLAAAVLPASAVNYVEIQGLHTVFYYDTDFFSPDNVSVSGDSIQFGLPTDISVTVNVAYAADSKTASTSIRTVSPLLAVAKDGYLLDVRASISANSTIASTTSKINGYTSISAAESAGTYSNGVFTSNGSSSMDLSTGQNGYSAVQAAGTRTYTTGSTACCLSGTAQAIKLTGTSFGVGVSQAGIGTQTFTLKSLTYSFNAVTAGTVINPPEAVPEPETYGMMLAGLGILGWVARRRSSRIISLA